VLEFWIFPVGQGEKSIFYAMCPLLMLLHSNFEQVAAYLGENWVVRH
jgi:hypothetical protein